MFIKKVRILRFISVIFLLIFFLGSNRQKSYAETTEFICKISKETNFYTVYAVASQDFIHIINFTHGKYSEDRCKFVAQRFTKLFKDDSLNYIVTGKIEGYKVICGFKEPTDYCKTKENVLIYLAEDENINKILRLLEAARAGARSGGVSINGNLAGDPTTDGPDPEIYQ